VKSAEIKIADERIRVKDKNDRATVEQCLDPRTLLVLQKMIKNEKLSKIHGCLSTGKEANVYLADGGEIDLETMEKKVESALSIKVELAIKVFKTSILKFKDRDRYV
jgi:RIO kinase 1